MLAVDDEDDILQIIRVNLELEGHEVVLAPNGERALEMVRNRRPDLVLLDVMMPGIDGWEVLRRLKGAPELSDAADVPVLMLTARVADEDRVRGGIEGAVRYLTKPFVPSLLCAEVQQALEGEPEPVQRRRARQEALVQLARMEKGAAAPGDAAAPAGGAADVRARAAAHLEAAGRDTGGLPVLRSTPAGLPLADRGAEPDAHPPRVAAMRAGLGELSEKQRQLLAVLGTTPSVSAAADLLHVSRSNIYASLRRISRRLGARSVPELLALVRTGELVASDPG